MLPLYAGCVNGGKHSLTHSFSIAWRWGCLSVLFFTGATRSLSNHRKTEESSTYVIRLHPKDDKTCFKQVFISINLILHIVFFSRADDDSCWALPTQCWYQEGHVIFSENANGCLVLLYKRNGLSWDKEELMVWVKRAISLKGICVVEAGYSFV